MSRAGKFDSEPAELALADARPSGDGWFRANCPYCLEQTGKEDRRRSLGMKPLISFFTCFKCGARGRLQNIPDEVMLVARRTAPAPEVEVVEPPEAYEPLADDWDSIFTAVPLSYVEGRGISREAIDEARVGACLSGGWRGRVIAPVLAVDQRTWLGYVGRDYTGRNELRYRYPKGMKRGRFLYNEAAIYAVTEEPLIFVEGIFDALPYWPDGTAGMGKPGDLHRRLLGQEVVTRPIAVCLDGDAWEEGWALSEYLTLSGRRAGSVRLPPGSDPNTVPTTWLKEEARRCIRH